MRNSEEIWRIVDGKRDAYVEMSDRVWDTPELAYGEHRSAATHLAMLEQEGFRITRDVAGIPTALMAEAGEEGPVIAILGEYDALPGLSQEAGVAAPRPIPGQDGIGHGCGHNLLGAAAMLAASSVKDWLAAQGIKGRVRYYGLPGGGRRGGQGVHGSCRRVQRCRRRDLLASGQPVGGQQAGQPGEHAHRFFFRRPVEPCGGKPASRSLGTGCRRTDECRRQLHARAYAERCAGSLRLS